MPPAGTRRLTPSIFTQFSSSLIASRAIQACAASPVLSISRAQPSAALRCSSPDLPISRSAQEAAFFTCARPSREFSRISHRYSPVFSAGSGPNRTPAAAISVNAARFLYVSAAETHPFIKLS